MVLVQNICYNEQKLLNSDGWNFSDKKTSTILKKIKEQSIPIGAYVDNKIRWGMMTGLSKAFVINEEEKNQIIADDPNSWVRGEQMLSSMFNNNIDRTRFISIQISSHDEVFDALKLFFNINGISKIRKDTR